MTTISDVGRMNRHVKLICSKRDIELRFDRKRGGRANVRGRVVSTAPIKSIVTYYIALHEVGHIIGRGRSGRLLEREYAAWKFALDRAIFPPDVAVWRTVTAGLGSYLYNAQTRAQWADARGSRHPVHLPAPDHPVWALMQEAISKSQHHTKITRSLLGPGAVDTILDTTEV